MESNDIDIWLGIDVGKTALGQQQRQYTRVAPHGSVPRRRDGTASLTQEICAAQTIHQRAFTGENSIGAAAPFITHARHTH